jgi:hypothetical protein
MFVGKLCVRFPQNAPYSVAVSFLSSVAFRQTKINPQLISDHFQIALTTTEVTLSLMPQQTRKKQPSTSPLSDPPLFRQLVNLKFISDKTEQNI